MKKTFPEGVSLREQVALLTSYDGQTISTDEIGNMLSDGTWTYTWEHGRELASMSDGSAMWNMTYDANGLRAKRTDGTTTYNYTYYSGQLVYMSVVYREVQYVYAINLQGNVVAILDTSGNVLVECNCDAWGNILSTTGSVASTFGKLLPVLVCSRGDV